MSPLFSDTTLRREELAHLPVALGEDVVGPSHILDVDRGARDELRQPRLEDRHALGAAVRTHDDDHAPPSRPLDLAHESSPESPLTRRAPHHLQALDVDDAPVHDTGAGRAGASPWHVGTFVTRSAPGGAAHHGAYVMDPRGPLAE